MGQIFLLIVFTGVMTLFVPFLYYSEGEDICPMRSSNGTGTLRAIGGCLSAMEKVDSLAALSRSSRQMRNKRSVQRMTLKTLQNVAST